MRLHIPQTIRMSEHRQRMWAHSFSGSLNLSAQNSAVAQIWAHKNNRLLNLYINLLIMRLNIPQNIRMSEHRQRMWVHSFSGLLNLSAQNSAVAQIWARKNNGSLNLYINLLIMRLNIPQTIRMSEHRQRCHECTVSAGRWIWALKIQQSLKFERPKITGRWICT